MPNPMYAPSSPSIIPSENEKLLHYYCRSCCKVSPIKMPVGPFNRVRPHHLVAHPKDVPNGYESSSKSHNTSNNHRGTSHSKDNNHLTKEETLDVFHLDEAKRRGFSVRDFSDREVALSVPGQKETNVLSVDGSTHICLQCYKNLMNQLEEERDFSVKQLEVYERKSAQLLRNQRRASQDGDKEENETEDTIQQLREELEKQNRIALEQRKTLMEQRKKLKTYAAYDKSYWNVFYQIKDRRRNHFAEETSLNRQRKHIKYLESYIKGFSQKKMFRLGFNGPVATINGLRLGSLSTCVVPWEEINAAWGLCALLLRLLANWMGVSFSSYVVKPMGSVSSMEHRETGKIYPLFFENIRTIDDFNQGMVAFLTCLREFTNHPSFQTVLSKNPSLKYTTIERDRINGDSIKLSVTSEGVWGAVIGKKHESIKESQEWTNALKNVVLFLRCIRHVA